MNKHILNKIIDIIDNNYVINTYSLLEELSKFGDPISILNNLIDEKIAERITEEKIDICTFDTLKFKRILKLKKIHKNKL